MHEGEALGLDVSSLFLTAAPIIFHGATLGTKKFTEYPVVDGHQERPQIIATVTETPNHETIGPGGACIAVLTDNPPKTTGALSLYDGHKVGVGRVLTSSTYHHFVDSNLTGEPASACRTPGVGPTGSNLGLRPDVLNAMRVFYVNAAKWLARSVKSVRCASTRTPSPSA